MEHFLKKHEMPIEITPEVRRHFDALLAWILNQEEAGYHNHLVPFSQKQGEIRAHCEEELLQIQKKLQHAITLLRDSFEKQNSTEAQKDSSFSVFEKAFDALRKRVQDPSFVITEFLFAAPIQEQMELPWSFMNRAYSIAKQLIEEKRYEEAEAVFTFLSLLHREVFEYWIGKAIAQQANHKFEEAVESYTESLFLQPLNPMPFFQMANCYYHMNELPSCLKSLELCIDLAKEDAQHSALVTEAKEMQQLVEVRKIA